MTLKAICNNPEKKGQDRLPRATARLAETWQEYENSQQDVLSLITENETVVGVANEIIKGKLRTMEGRKRSGARLGKPTHDGDRQGNTTKHKAMVDNLLYTNAQEPPAKEIRLEQLSQAGPNAAPTVNKAVFKEVREGRSNLFQPEG